MGPPPLELLQVGDKLGADSGLVQLGDRHLLGACAGGVMHNLGVKPAILLLSWWCSSNPDISCSPEEQADGGWPRGVPGFCGCVAGWPQCSEQRVKSYLVKLPTPQGIIFPDSITTFLCFFPSGCTSLWDASAAVSHHPHGPQIQVSSREAERGV